MKKKAVVLFSGGLDSSTCLVLAQSQGYQCTALSFAYGQKHSVELLAAKALTQHLGVQHHILVLDTELFRGSSLTDKNLEVPDFEEGTKIPLTYVPARNLIFLSMALGFAESLGARDLFIGVSSVDYSHYPDCRPDFIQGFQDLANLATKAGVEGDPFRIHAPLQHLSKAQTIALGMDLGLDYGLTISCYQANEAGEACGVCASCILRKQGFFQAKKKDPTKYV